MFQLSQYRDQANFSSFFFVDAPFYNVICLPAPGGFENLRTFHVC